MGIRFVCPNGHRLNVKAFLAGKKGICPHCGTKVDIPHESTPEAIKRSTTKIPLPPRGAPAAMPTAASEEAAASQLTTDVPQQPANTVPPVAADDPFAIDANWYVHAVDGQQYGPATATQMREWVVEGRVAAGCLVWRDDWPEWKQAADVLPNVPAPTEPVAEFAFDGEAAPVAIDPLASPHRLRGRRKSKSRAVMTVTMLGVACLILFAVFLFVVVGF